MSGSTHIFTLPKKERLCSKKLIDHLFLCPAHTKKVWPVKARFQVVDKTEDDEPSVMILVSVSKRCFKRAVKRNRVKRQLREAYRLQKQLLAEAMSAQCPGKRLLVAFVWMEAKLHDTATVETAMVSLMEKVAGSLSEEGK
jgi:ribonuclease P protein component